jgi:hypothetical protein
MECITSVTPTICEVVEVPRPAISTDRTLTGVVRAVRENIGTGHVERCLVFAPDAIGRSLFRERIDRFSPVLERAPHMAELRSVVPPKTPVCFASMFTGAMPEGHGIRKYERPVLTCDTLFDALARAGKRVAIVAVKGSSIDTIFRQRKVDYFSEDYDKEVRSRAIGLIEADRHEFILAYNQEYDDEMHRNGPRSPEALRAMDNHIRTFQELTDAVDRHWGGHDRLIAFTPDHGAHDEKDGPRKGDHGQDIPEDMEVVHLFGVGKGGHR